MKNYTITVNGQTYVVQVEEGITAAAQAAPVVTIPQAPVYAAPAPVLRHRHRLPHRHRLRHRLPQHRQAQQAVLPLSPRCPARS